MLPTLKSPGETINDLNTRAKDAGETLSNMAKPSSMVSGRAACVVAANGAPDCKAGADRLCQSKGYKEGKSLDTDAAEKCSRKSTCRAANASPAIAGQKITSPGRFASRLIRTRRAALAQTGHRFSGKITIEQRDRAG